MKKILSKNAGLTLFIEAFSEWRKDEVPRLAAALSYYTVFSVTPLLLIVIAVASVFFGEGTARTQLINQLSLYLGPKAASSLTDLLPSHTQSHEAFITSLVGFVSLVLGGSGIFSHLKESFKAMWHTEMKKKNFRQKVKENILSFILVFSVGWLLIISLVISSIVTALSIYFSRLMPFSVLVTQCINFFSSLVVIAALFAAMFKVLIPMKTAWKYIWGGAVVTSFLFTVGKFLIDLYLSYTNGMTTYGTAGSLIVVLLWVYYSAQILFFGAEFIKVFSSSRSELYGRYSK